jgi:hypothetical protein
MDHGTSNGRNVGKAMRREKWNEYQNVLDPLLHTDCLQPNPQANTGLWDYLRDRRSPPGGIQRSPVLVQPEMER